MSFDKHQLEDLIIRILKEFNLYSQEAVDLLLGTAAQESQFGRYIRQLGNGPALGIFQMEPNTEKDIWENFIKFKPELKTKLFNKFHIDKPSSELLEYNLAYQIIMARIHYYRVRESIPKENLAGLAKYWKQYYNTPLGKGTPEEFIKNYGKYLA